MALYTEQQLRLKATFKNEVGAVIDPGAVTLKIEAPDNSSVEVGTTKDSVGVYHALYTPAMPGIYFARWKGTAPLETSLEESFYVEVSAFSSTAIITVDELLSAKGELRADTEATQLQRYEEAVTHASQAIRTFTDRAFGIPLTASTKPYDYEGTLILIDDCWKINKVFIRFGSFRTEVNTEYWRAEPLNGPPYTYLIVPTAYGGLSPEMGFTRNLDVFVKERGWPYFIPTIEVEGEWGWAVVPADVRRAAILTAVEMADTPQPYLNESIAGYSYSTAARGPAGGSLTAATSLIPSALPARAQDLLYPYISPNI